MASSDDRRLEKRIPSNIICSLAYIDYENFPINCNGVSKTEMSRILHYFLRTGESFKNIKKLLLEVIEGKENEISDFVKNYKQVKNNHIAENIIMIFLGFFVTIGLLRGLVVIGNK